MSYYDEPKKRIISSMDSRQTLHYVLKSSLHHHGWKLEVRELKGPLLFKVIRHPIHPSYYKLQSLNSQKINPMKIKSLLFEDTFRYVLYDGNKEQVSILSDQNSPEVLFRNHQRKTIARFSPLSSEVVLLRTPRATVARLRFKEKPTPLSFKVECEAEVGLQWLFALILYSVAHIENTKPTPHPEKTELEEDEKTE